MAKVKSPHRQLAIAAARAASEKKAVDILVLDIASVSDVTDYMVIAGAESSAQMGAIQKQVEEDLRELGAKPLHKDGGPRDRWLALDYGVIMVHVLLPSAREFYRLEQLWENAQRIKWEKR